jgi:ATP-dependent helicase HrpA
VAPLTAAVFGTVRDRAQADLRGLVPRFCDQLREILALRQAVMIQPNAPPGAERDLATLLPPDFLRTTPYAQLAHFPRYLKAMKLRAERWRQSPAKDAERVALITPYEKALAQLAGSAGPGRAVLSAEVTPELAPTPTGWDALRWLVEEFRVSLFAQELGTAEPVSAVKLDRMVAALKAGRVENPGSSIAAVTAPPKPILAAPVAQKKPAAVKNFNALDRLFRP